MRLLLDGRDISFKKVWLYFVPWSAWQTPGDHLVLPIVHEILAEGTVDQMFHFASLAPFKDSI